MQIAREKAEKAEWFEAEYEYMECNADDAVKVRESSKKILEKSKHISYSWSLRASVPSPTSWQKLRTTTYSKSLMLYALVVDNADIKSWMIAFAHMQARRQVEMPVKIWNSANNSWKMRLHTVNYSIILHTAGKAATTKSSAWLSSWTDHFCAYKRWLY